MLNSLPDFAIYCNKWEGDKKGCFSGLPVEVKGQEQSRHRERSEAIQKKIVRCVESYLLFKSQKKAH